MAGTSQRAVGAASRMSPSNVSRIEHGRLLGLSIADAVVLADAVGLDVSFKLYPGRRPTRDAAHGERLRRLLAQVGPPLKFGTEVPLPPRDGAPEQRSWDALIYAEDGQTGVELEMRLYDVQAQTRRIRLKWRDSGVERLLLVIAETTANRRTLHSFADYFTDLPQLRTATVLPTLRAGNRPPTGLILL